MKLSTSILSSENRIESVLKLNKTNTDYIHVDVMDGKFVEDIQFETYEKVHSIHLVSYKSLDIHLMVKSPLGYIEQLSNMNIEFITFHVEINGDKKGVIQSIHDRGYKVGLAIKPGTDIKVLEKYLDDIDMILVMSVEPGKGGQAFLEGTVDRIKMVKELIGSRNILIEVDGGINDKTIDMVRDVDIVVSGSYIVKSDNYYDAIESLLVKDEEEINDKKNKEGFGFGWIPVIFGIIFYGFLLWLLIMFWMASLISISDIFIIIFYSLVLPFGIISIFVYLFYRWKENKKSNRK